MTTEWEFLEPWRAALHGSLIPGNLTAHDSFMDVCFICHERNITQQREITLRLQHDEGSNQDGERQRLREAVELFTLLSFVNNQAFIELTDSLTPDRQAQSNNGETVQVRWAFRLVEPLSPNRAPVGHDHITWGAFLGFPDDPFQYSSDFRAAAQRLEAMGYKESCKTCFGVGSTIYWTLRLQCCCVHGRQKPEKSPDTLNLFRSLRNVIVPPIVLACTTPDWASMTAAGKSPSSSDRPCSNSVGAAVRNWASPVVLDLAKGLVMTAVNHFSLRLEGETINSPAAMINAGFLLNSLVCGRAVCEGIGSTSPSSFQLEYRRLDISCVWVCDKLFTATCSAIAEMPLETPLFKLGTGLEDSGRWSWLAYTLCGGASEAIIPSVEIVRGTLTKSDVQIMSTVLRTNYPQPLLENGQRDSHNYGFVNIGEGTELHLCGVNDVDIGTFVVPSRCRCRALYDPTDSKWISIVVPGYGMCKSILGGGAQFVPDPEKPCFRKKRVSTGLVISYVKFETSTVLMDMLALVTSGLRKLKIYADNDDMTHRIDVDLYALSIACPELQDLTIGIFNVIVSAYDEPLRRWSVKTIRLHEYTGRLSDLAECLRNSTPQLSRSLVCIEVDPPRHGECNKQEVEELMAHNGEFLPVTKEKFPIKSKLAVLSVVTRPSCATESICLFDAYILSIVFVFASTPAQRSVAYSGFN
ncbi:unnamed protein product [Phytophthora fragariaefolia]|uniref:Unnamed protein product n=1 Tax=Phytophthora fragariaefolia TaxID=1490495 RepID=A0A9W6XR21_9STRA|nr:unnamed protein product [Phytophthora fragariaefolia]